jgi:RNA polymerase primary sigma factor
MASGMQGKLQKEKGRATRGAAVSRSTVRGRPDQPPATRQDDCTGEASGRRLQMRALIQLGKERGFLTHGDINDHLQENVADSAAMEGIARTFEEMGVAVYEQAPDAETLLLNGNASAISPDAQVDEEAEVVLSTMEPSLGARPIRRGFTCGKWVRPPC